MKTDAPHDVGRIIPRRIATGAKFEGYRDFIVQDIVIGSSRKTVTAGAFNRLPMGL